MVSVHYSQLFSLLCVFTSDLFWSSGEQRLTKITNKAKRFKKGAGKSNVIELFLVFHGVIGVIHSSKNVFSSYPVDFDVTECAIPTMYGLYCPKNKYLAHFSENFCSGESVKIQCSMQ